MNKSEIIAIRQLITFKAATQATGSDYNGHNKQRSQEAEANKGQQEILHGGIEQAINIYQVRDTAGDQEIVNGLEHMTPILL